MLIFQKKLRKLEKKIKKTDRFGFISLKSKKPNRKKTESNRNKNRVKLKKPSQNEKTKPNQFELVFLLKNRTKIDRFEPVLIFKFFLFNFFLIKTESN
jgi:hypothetical protein